VIAPKKRREQFRIANYRNVTYPTQQPREDFMWSGYFELTDVAAFCAELDRIHENPEPMP
jgi:hypothetical protein